MASDGIRVISEFAAVRVELDTTANGPRLLVTDEKTGCSRHLDPLVLEGLAWADNDDLVRFVDPSKRWALESAGDGVDG